MLLVTTPSLDGAEIAEYFGIVTGEAILGANIFRDLFAGIRDIVGGRAAGYEKELREARQLALEQLGWEAEQLGADAVVGVALDHEAISFGRRMDALEGITPSPTEHPAAPAPAVAELIGEIEAANVGPGRAGGAESQPDPHVPPQTGLLVRVPRAAVVHEPRQPDPYHMQHFIHREPAVLDRPPDGPGAGKRV